MRFGRDFLFGVRISARDFNYLPLNLRWPVASPLRDWWFGNDIDTTLEYGRRLKDLGVDYLHVSNGYGFINPKENPGAFPLDEIRAFFNSTRHLGWKAAARSMLLNGLPGPVRRATGVGWNAEPGANLDDAAAFRREVGLPVIANGGFQRRSLVERALTSGSCDLVSMARPLLANPNLPELFREAVSCPIGPARSATAARFAPRRVRSAAMSRSASVHWRRWSSRSCPGPHLPGRTGSSASRQAAMSHLSAGTR